jgi:hypothetical protein
LFFRPWRLGRFFPVSGYLKTCLLRFFIPGGNISCKGRPTLYTRTPEFINDFTMGANQFLPWLLFLLFLQGFWTCWEIFFRDKGAPAIIAKLLFFLVFDVTTQADAH